MQAMCQEARWLGREHLLAWAQDAMGQRHRILDFAPTASYKAPKSSNSYRFAERAISAG
jgi:hypothetical protein